MKQLNEKEYYENINEWNFDRFEIDTENFTNWDLYDTLNSLSNKSSKILDLGTGGGEKALKYFPDCAYVLATDFSLQMIETAKKNLLKSGRKNFTFRYMDNLVMDTPSNFFDVVVARNTKIDPKQIFKTLKKGGYLLIHGVDMYDCHSLKMCFGRGQAFNDTKPISIIDYENVLAAGFSDVELIPIYVKEYYKNREQFKEFLQMVPILDDFSEENDDNKTNVSKIEDDLLNIYISNNTYNGKIRLLRRYYGILARKK